MINALLDEFRPGQRIYLPGATGEIVQLAQALQADPQRMQDVTIVSCLLPGINHFDYAALDESARLITFLLPPALHASFELGKVRVIPQSYSAIVGFLRNVARIDAAVAHLSLPTVDGFCSFGIAADFSPIAWRAARRRIAVINPRMPAMRRGPRVALDEADLVVECESPLLEVAPLPPASADVQSISRTAASLIPDGATLQIGLGSLPGALCSDLSSHKDLKLRSGLVPEAVRSLAEAGALGASNTHRGGIAAGTASFYRYLGESDLIGFDTTEATHDTGALARIDRFYAINSALQIDLFGQVNLEWKGNQLASGVGGAPDFVRGALGSRDGGSILMMPATARCGSVSRIVGRLESPTVSLTRAEVDTVITEYGVARLRDLSIDERPAALIALAAEPFRYELGRAWRERRKYF